jgi:hypothetical protein
MAKVEKVRALSAIHRSPKVSLSALCVPLRSFAIFAVKNFPSHPQHHLILAVGDVEAKGSENTIEFAIYRLVE